MEGREGAEAPPTREQQVQEKAHRKLELLRMLHDAGRDGLRNSEMEDRLVELRLPTTARNLADYLKELHDHFGQWISHEWGRWRGYHGFRDQLHAVLHSLPGFARRWKRQPEARDAIAWYVAENLRVGPNQWLAFDASTTVARAAWYLWRIRRERDPDFSGNSLRMVTNNVVAAWCFMLMGSNVVDRLHSVGDHLDRGLGALQTSRERDHKECVGCAVPSGAQFSMALLGANYVSFDHGLLIEDGQQDAHKGELMRRANQVWVLVDHAKVGVTCDDPASNGTVRVVPQDKEWSELRQKTTIIVDCGVPPVVATARDRASERELKRLEADKAKWLKLRPGGFVVVDKPAGEPTLSAPADLV